MIFLLAASFSISASLSKDFMDSVVGVYVEYPANPNPNIPTQAFGSGVIVSDDGYIVTNHHVVNQAYNIVVQTDSGQKAYANIVGTAPDFDLAVIKIDPIPNQKLHPIKLGASNALNVGEDVTAVGNSFGFDQTLSQGVISQLDREINLSNRVKSYIQVDAAVNPGNSGGALLNNQGELIGIVSGIYGPKFNIGIAFAIPIDVAKPVITQLITKGYITPGWIGMATQPLTPELKDAFQVPNYDGIVISEVTPGSPADKANLQARDIILQINDVPVTSPQHFSSIVTAQGSQSMIFLSYLRNNKVFNTRFKTDRPMQSTRTALGHWGLNLTEYDHMNFDGVQDHGILINRVQEKSSGSLSGLQPGDIIKSIDNVPIKRLNDFKTHQFNRNERTHLLEIIRQEHTLFIPLR